MKKVLFRVPILSRSGYGKQAENLLKAALKYPDEIDPYIIPINWGHTSWVSEDTEFRRKIDQIIAKTTHLQRANQIAADVSVQCTIPNEFMNLAPININYCAGIETNRISTEWVEKSNLYTKIFLVSEFAKEVYLNTSYDVQDKQTGQKISNYKVQSPIEVFTFPYENYGLEENFKLDLKYDFNFLIIAQWGPRKNLENTLRWWMEEFHDKEVGLVLKISIRNMSTSDRFYCEKRLEGFLKLWENKKAQVVLLHGDMTERELGSLYNHEKIKSLINISHGECFGLPMFEAACHGMPIITTDFGGQRDFLYAPKEDKKTQKIKNKAHFCKVDFDLAPIQPEAVWNGVLEKNSLWAFPKEGSFKVSCKEMINNYQYFKSLAKKLREYLQEKYNEEEIHKAFVESLLGKKLIKVEVKDLPKISIITSVFRGAEFIDGFLKDIESQTIFKEKCEIIFVHPKTSPDFELERQKILEFQKKYFENVIYEVLEEDKGVYWCWNHGVGKATGEFITNANLDDRKLPTSLEIHAKELYKNPDIDLVYADSLITRMPNETFEHTTAKERYEFDQFSIESMLRGNLPHQCPMWRKSLHEKNGNFREDYFSCSDWHFWLTCCFNGSKFLKINQVLGLYLFNETGLSTNKETEKQKTAQEMEVFREFQQKYLKLQSEKHKK